MTKGNTHSGGQRNANWPTGLEWDDVLDNFPYAEPRDVQEDGMRSVLDAASDDGYVLMEGACGTGKTLIALAPYISMVRNQNTKFERIVVVTSVKQQQRAFEDEVRRINKKLTQNQRNPVSALTLVGKADVCPYVQQGTISNKAIYEDCDNLRENTSKLIKGDTSLGMGTEPTSGDKLVKQAESMHEGDHDEDADGPHYVFDDVIPVDDDTGTQFCPYYANHLHSKSEDGKEDRSPADPSSDTIPFDLDTVGLITPERLLGLAGEAGTCPHSVMGEALGRVELVIANYYHVFEPTTVETFTNDLIDDETLVVIDEAHNLPNRVQDLLNRERSLHSFDRAVDEARELLPLLEYERGPIERISDAMEQGGALAGTMLSDDLREAYADIEERVGDPDSMAASPEEFIELSLEAHDTMDKIPVSAEQVEAWADFIEEFAEAVDRTVTEKFEEFQRKGEEPSYEFEVPLREPRLDPNASANEWKDKLSAWMELVPDNRGAIADCSSIGKAVVKLQSHLREEVLEYDELPKFSADGAGEFIKMWRKFDQSQYFRLVQMERRASVPGDNYRFDWQEDYGATLTLYNCIPREEIAERLSEFGAGVLMSATLVPLHVTRKVTGLDELESKGRSVIEEQYGLTFPEENRMSFSVDAPAFKYNNKKGAFDRMGNPNLNNEVREQYAQAIFNVVQTTPGNVLITMPSYTEAEWAGELLRDHQDIDRSRVLIDESSTNFETERMKQKFFDSDDGILVTGAHGTLTEGIDYKGNRLGAVVCCGVPIENTNNVFSKAVRTAYEVEFGKSNGFEYAFTVPAVHKTRQALGRVIRTADDVGVRVLIDTRYTNSSDWDNVREFLSPNEQREFQDINPDALFNQLKAFWNYHGKGK